METRSPVGVVKEIKKGEIEGWDAGTISCLGKEGVSPKFLAENLLIRDYDVPKWWLHKKRV